jgi:hypothetical protein
MVHAGWTGACSMDLDTQQEHIHGHGHRQDIDRHGQRITLSSEGIAEKIAKVSEIVSGISCKVSRS